MMSARTRGARAAVVLLVAAAAAVGADYVYHPRDATEAGGNPRFVVPDPEAEGGSAQAAIPGQSRPGSYTCAFYAYARPAASYRVTWRLAIDDNTIPEVVVRVWTRDEQGRPGFKGGDLQVKGTEFAAPRKYQEFSYTAEKAEGGFFNVGAVWTGKGRLHIDRIVIAPVTFFTEKEILGRGKAPELPEAWVLTRPAPPTVHLGKGLWWEFFGLSEAMAELGGAVVTSSYHASGQYGYTLRNFPARWQDLAAGNLIVLTNVNAPALGPAGRLLLEEYVQNGGALLVCGGPFAFERGEYRHTALDRLLPVGLEGEDRVRAEGGLPLKPGPDAAAVLPADLAWALAPQVFYTHTVKPRAGAQVLALAGDRPVLVAWTVGKGRVAAFAATAEGEPGPGQVAFWEWGDQPRLMAAVCRWLMAPQADAPAPAAASAGNERLLQQLLSPSTGEDNAERESALQRLLAQCHDQAFARQLVEAVGSFEGTPDRTFVTGLARAVRPFVDASFADATERLIRSGNAGKAALGLHLRGMGRGAGARELLEQVLERGAGALGTQADDDVSLEEMVKSSTGGEVGTDERLKLAAAIALGDLGDVAALAALRTIRPGAGARPGGANADEVEDLKENLAQQALAARVRLGDAEAVAPLWDEVLRNAEQIELYRNYLDVMLLDAKDKELIWGRRIAAIRLPVMRQRQALCFDMLRQTPPGVAGAVAEQLAQRSDPRAISMAYATVAAWDGKALTPAARQAFLAVVEQAQAPEIRRLAVNLILAADDAAAAELTPVLARLAAAPDKAGARFALQQVGRLPEAARGAVVAPALKHPDATVQRLARASLALVPTAERGKLAP